MVIIIISRSVAIVSIIARACVLFTLVLWYLVGQRACLKRRVCYQALTAWLKPTCTLSQKIILWSSSPELGLPYQRQPTLYILLS